MRILFVSKSTPYPAASGTNQRTELIYRALSSIADVDLILTCDPEKQPRGALDYLRQNYGLLDCVRPAPRSSKGGWTALAAIHSELAERAAHHLGAKHVHYAVDRRVNQVFEQALNNTSYDLVVSRYLHPAAISGALDSAPVLVDVDDIDYEVWRWRCESERTPRWQRPIARAHYKSLRKLVPTLLSRARGAWVTNPADLDRLREHSSLQNHPISILPNIPFPRTAAEDLVPRNAPESRQILTVALFSYRPNVEGVDHFVRRIWPRIRAEHPDARYRIIGKNLPSALAEQWRQVPGVEPVGYVDDLRQEYQAAAYSVAPIYYGGGTSIKVLESLAHERTCVVTPYIFNGYRDRLLDGESILVGDNDAVFAKCCTKLLSAPELARRLAGRGREVVADRYTFEQFREVVVRDVRATIRSQSSAFIGRLGHKVVPA